MRDKVSKFETHKSKLSLIKAPINAELITDAWCRSRISSGLASGEIILKQGRDYLGTTIMAKAQQQQAGSAKAASKKRVVKVDAYGDAHISATFNNIIISLTNKSGQTIAWSSAGKMGFRGSKKNTPYAAQMAAADAAKTAFDAGLKRVDVFVKGPGSGRESSIRSLSQSGIEIVMIKDVTPMPHNGCRPPKKRRV